MMLIIDIIGFVYFSEDMPEYCDVSEVKQIKYQKMQSIYYI